jgi:YbbR domain-containing protein
VTIDGPTSVVQQLTSIDTEEFDLGGMNSDQTRLVPLQIPTGVTAERESVNVTFHIEPTVATWAVPVAPAAENVPDGLQAVFQTKQITVVVESSQR